MSAARLTQDSAHRKGFFPFRRLSLSIASCHCTYFTYRDGAMFSETIILMHPPSVSLTKWKVMEVSSSSVEVSTLHLIGWAGHNVRVSSPIFECDAVMRTCMTRSRNRSEEQTSKLQSLMRISYAAFCLNKKKKQIKHYNNQ